MKKVIRREVWETNSSMTHSCVIMTAEQDKKWKEENLYYYPEARYWYDPFDKVPEDSKPKHGCFYTQEEVLNFYKLQGYECDMDIYDDEEDPVDAFIREMCDFIRYDTWNNDDYLEYDEHTFVTPGGETIVVSCLYGRDG